MKNQIEIKFDKNNTQAIDHNIITSIGLFSDVQYADVEDGMCHHKINTRYYRNSLNMLKKILEQFKNHEQKSCKSLKCLVQLGDLIDGKCKLDNSSKKCLNKCLDELNKMVNSETSLLHIWGNHEFYNFLRKDLLESNLNTSKILDSKTQSTSNDYVFNISENLDLICLDFYEFSIIGYEGNEKIYLDAHEYYTYLKQTAQRKFVAFREGALSQKQLKWLENELRKCREKNCYVIVCGHLPIFGTPEKFQALNSNEILQLIWNYNQNVVAYICGHYHPGFYCQDSYAIHHLTLPGIVETDLNDNPSVIIDVHKDKILINTFFDLSKFINK